MTSHILQLVVDDEIDAAYIDLQNHGKKSVAKSIEINNRNLAGTVVLDIDANGRLLGIEFIGYQAMLDGIPDIRIKPGWNNTGRYKTTEDALANSTIRRRLRQK